MEGLRTGNLAASGASDSDGGHLDGRLQNTREGECYEGLLRGAAMRDGMRGGMFICSRCPSDRSSLFRVNSEWQRGDQQRLP